jgi:2-keto-4-pentenoate hydratase/2-oxohepta-3-ene-1,7-dioic acid hydratase in catechol pathway
MKFCRFSAGDGAPLFGRVEGDVVVPLAAAPFAGQSEAGPAVPLADVTLLPPTLPSTFFCAGMNFARHVGEAAAHGNATARVPQRPDIGYRANNALVGHMAPIVKPADCEGRFEYEAELVAVIGRRLRHASRQEATDGIFGWTTGNDVSARTWQYADRTMWRGKNADSFKPMGPWIDTDASPMDGHATTFVNGVETSRYRLADMLFDAVDFIHEITRYITMEPGDVIWLGTDGVGAIAPGDVVSIRIDGLDPLTNPVVLGQ